MNNFSDNISDDISDRLGGGEEVKLGDGLVDQLVEALVTIYGDVSMACVFGSLSISDARGKISDKIRDRIMVCASIVKYV